MLKGISSILLVLSLSFPSYACDNNVKYLTQGTPAPCTGYLFSPEQEYKVRLSTERYEIMKLMVEKQTDINNVLEERLKNTQQYNEYLSQRLRKEKKDDFWHKTIYFGLGAVLTGVIAANVR